MSNDVYEDLTLEEVMAKADEKAAYTQQDIVIYDEDENEVARRQWYGTCAGLSEEGDADIIRFGDFGYFGEWQQY
jgi:hypothetical protein